MVGQDGCKGAAQGNWELHREFGPEEFFGVSLGALPRATLRLREGREKKLH